METLARAANRGSIATGAGYEIENSLKFEADNSEYLSKTFSSGNNKTWTYSCWVKKTELVSSGDGATLFDSHFNLTRYFFLSFYQDTIIIYNYNGGIDYGKTTTQVFRDTSAWYHIVLSVDTTDATAADRMKLYVNGTRVTSFSGDFGDFPLNYDTEVNKAQTHYIGYRPDATVYSSYYITETHHIDGQALTASDFGEFDTDTGIWKPKAYTGSYGNNGFYLDFEDSASLGADDSGNGNDFTLSNITSADQATDTPTNNFATNNPLAQSDMNPLQGATQWTHNNASDWESSISTIGVTKGKWYFEASMDSTGNMIGIIANNGITDSLNCMDSYAGDRLDTQNAGIGYHGAGNVFQNDTFTSGMPTYGGGNIISCALDMDNGYVYFARNGSWINSGDPTSGSSGTGGWAVYDTSDIQFFATSIYSTSDNIKCNWGGFRIYSLSSAETDANGYGTFEYAPPSGYYALCTKNLAEFG